MEEVTPTSYGHLRSDSYCHFVNRSYTYTNFLVTHGKKEVSLLCLELQNVILEEYFIQLVHSVSYYSQEVSVIAILLVVLLHTLISKKRNEFTMSRTLKKN